MLAQPIAGTFDLYDDRMVKQAIKQRSGDDGITKNFAPLGEAAVGGDDHGAPLVAGVDQLEEQIAGAGTDAQVSDLIDDEQLSATEKADAFAQPTLAIGACEAVDDVGERREVDAAAGTHGFDTKSDCQMRFAGAGRSSVILPGFRRARNGSPTRSIQGTGS